MPAVPMTFFLNRAERDAATPARDEPDRPGARQLQAKVGGHEPGVSTAAAAAAAAS